MRHAGRIHDWNDARGFGFVTPHDGGARAFVHIRAFQPGSRRPVDGDLVSYETVTDAKGRLNAAGVRFAGQRVASAPVPAGERARPAARRRVAAAGGRGPAVGIALGVFALMAVAIAQGRLPVLVGAAVLGLSLVSWILYCLDKAAAEQGAWRIPEAWLHLVDLAGGWPGGLLAQRQFRHKTVKASFQAGFWMTVLANLAALGWLASGHGAGWLRAIGGG